MCARATLKHCRVLKQRHTNTHIECNLLYAPIILNGMWLSFIWRKRERESKARSSHTTRKHDQFSFGWKWKQPPRLTTTLPYEVLAADKGWKRMLDEIISFKQIIDSLMLFGKLTLKMDAFFKVVNILCSFLHYNDFSLIFGFFSRK